MTKKEEYLIREALVHDLTQKAIRLWGEKRALAMTERIEKTADQLFAISKNPPHFEEVPTLTWQNKP